MDTLNILFGGPIRVKMMRLFIFNQDDSFDEKTITERLKIKKSLVVKELSALLKAEFIKKTVFQRIVEKKYRGKIQTLKIKIRGYIFNPDFSHTQIFRQLLVNSKSLGEKEILNKLSKSGKLKLVLVSGFFIQDPDSRADILVVGDKVKKNVLHNAIKSIESELAKDLNYAFFETEDFKYRMTLNDKLLRDILDYPHRILLDKLSS